MSNLYAEKAESQTQPLRLDRRRGLVRDGIIVSPSLNN